MVAEVTGKEHSAYSPVRRSSSFSCSTNPILLHLTQCTADKVAWGPEIHPVAFGWHCIHAWLFCLGMVLCRGLASSGLSLGSTGSAVLQHTFDCSQLDMMLRMNGSFIGCSRIVADKAGFESKPSESLCRGIFESHGN